MIRRRDEKDDLITECRWLLFDFIKPCLISCPKIDIEPEYTSDLNFPCVKALISYNVSFTFTARAQDSMSKRIGFYQVMLEIIQGVRKLSSVASIFKDDDVYEIAMAVLQKLILAGKVTKDECIRALSKAECHEAVAELIQFDDGKEHEEDFKL